MAPPCPPHLVCPTLSPISPGAPWVIHQLIHQLIDQLIDQLITTQLCGCCFREGLGTLTPRHMRPASASVVQPPSYSRPRLSQARSSWRLSSQPPRGGISWPKKLNPNLITRQQGTESGACGVRERTGLMGS